MVTAEFDMSRAEGASTDQRIHILFVVASLAYGGAEKHLLTLVNNLDTSRFKLSLAYLKNDCSLLMQLDRGKIEGRVFCCDVRGGLELDVVRHLANLLDDEDVRLIVAVNCYAYSYALAGRTLARARPRIMTIFHSTVMLTNRERIRMAVYKQLFSYCDCVVYVCRHQQAYWRAKRLKARSEQVIYNGVDLDRFNDNYTHEQKAQLRRTLGFGSGDFVVGLCGAMRPEKAHADLLRAMAVVPPGRLRLRCLLIGDGPERHAITSIARDLGVIDRVAITGFVADVRPFIAACDAMALVSRTEAFSLAALESMSMAKPLLMTRVGGAEEQVEHGVTGLLLPPGHIDSLAQQIQFLQSSGSAVEMGRRARAKVASQFSEPAMIAAYQTVFDSLLNCTRDTTATLH